MNNYLGLATDFINYIFVISLKNKLEMKTAKILPVSQKQQPPATTSKLTKTLDAVGKKENVGGEEKDKANEEEDADGNDDGEESDEYEEGSASDDSLGNPKKDEKTEEKKKKKKTKGQILTASKTNFVTMRNELKEKVIREVLSEVMPDIGAYDVNAEPPKKKEFWYDPITNWFKFCGCIDLDLHDAVISGSEKLVDAALERYIKGKKSERGLVNQYDARGRTALSLAVKAKQEGMVYSMLNKHVLPDIMDQDNGRTPLYYSAMLGTFDISKLLIMAGASVNTCDFKCVTPLMMSCNIGDYSTLRLILNTRPLPDIDAQDDNGWTALHYGNKFYISHSPNDLRS